jgi:muramoyltetrapeptide carboxypeptidase LdcA involved in peptidoglycan recycling
LFGANPKPFFGYSDNTNLLNWLWNLGIVGYHGGSTMVHLARPGGLHELTMASLRSALFTNDTFDVAPVETFTDLHADWADLRTLETALPTTPEPGWQWHNATSNVAGRSWGGNLEILHWNLAAGRWILPNDRYRGCVLFLETSEEMPPGEEVFRMLRNMGERGLLEKFSALIYAKPKAWDRERQTTPSQRSQFREDHYAAVLRAMARYNPDAMVVLGPDFGHTDPQVIIPVGGTITLDGPARRLSVTY